MSLFGRHGDHGHGHEDEDEHGHGHGHGHPSEDSVRQHFLACLYWYALAAVLVIGSIARLLSVFVARQRIKRRHLRESSDTSISTIERWLETPKSALSASPLYRRRPLWLATLPLRKTITVAAYAAFIAFLLTWKSIKHDDNYLERVAFRAAWVTATQTSLPLLLAVRVNPIGLLLGTSYERINWFHRWASRIFFASATVHGSFFVTEWLAADFFWIELRTVGMVKWGIAAWSVLAWTLVSTLPPFRRLRYEFFVLQHVASVVLLLLFLVLHVPRHHLFSIWCAVGVFVYDVVTRSANPIWRNARLRFSSVRYGHEASVEAVDDELTMVTIRNVGFTWTPGQHLLIWAPTFRWESPHPFTISSVPKRDSSTQDVQLTLKTKRGLTRRLNDWARKAENGGSDGSMRLLVTGPFGFVPNWRQYDNLVLIAASTGGSFITPILEDLLTSQSPGCVRKINALYIVRRKAHAEPYIHKISRVLSRAKEMGISARVEVAVTKGSGNVAEGVLHDGADESRERLIEPEPRHDRGDSVELERFSLESSRSSGSARDEQLLKEEAELGLDDGYAYDTSSIEQSEGRPDIAAFVQTAAGSAPGSVAVAVCGGRAVEDVVRTSVASLRGGGSGVMGARDIFLHVERSDI
ncbi:hypothetical protein ACJ41O_009335 [Fusarium nematophilum]